jgi:glutamyl-tRNA synthetase
MSIRVRFAPSPTGYLHVGGLRTALFNYLYAKQVGGEIILRIEDTDQSRIVNNAIEHLVASFNCLKIKFDEGPGIGGDKGPYYQSQRLYIYKDQIKTLLNNGFAYPCFCAPERLEKLRKKLSLDKKTLIYDRHCMGLTKKEAENRRKSEEYVIRMKIPDRKEVIFYDAVRDKVVIKCAELDDQILIKSDGYPTYHFANVIDDHLMNITHVIRGEEWLSSTPKHVLLYEYLGWDLPRFIHLPLLLNPDKSKLSKRQGDVGVEDYLQKGYLPETIINFVALLGWHPNNEQEIFSLKNLEKEFSLKRIQKSGAVFDIEKLNWMNSQYLINLPLEQIAEKAKPFFNKREFDLSDKAKYLQVIENARRRVKTIEEIPKESIMFYKEITLTQNDIKIISTKNSKLLLSQISTHLKDKDELNKDGFGQLLMEISNSLGITGKNLFFPIRVVLYGNSKGPDIPLIYSILGREETLNRLEKYI